MTDNPKKAGELGFDETTIKSELAALEGLGRWVGGLGAMLCFVVCNPEPGRMGRPLGKHRIAGVGGLRWRMPGWRSSPFSPTFRRDIPCRRRGLHFGGHHKKDDWPDYRQHGSHRAHECNWLSAEDRNFEGGINIRRI